MEWERIQAWFGEQKLAEGTFAGVTVAAHAYAAAVAMFEEGRPARTPGAAPRVGALASAIAGVADAANTGDRYDALLAVLLACEADLADPGRRAGLPRGTSLDAQSGLGGMVRHAWRGRAAWRARRHRRHEDLGPGPTSYALHPDDQLDHLWFAWSRGEPLLYAPLEARNLSSRRIVTDLGTRLDAGSLRLALCPLSGSAGPRFRVDGSGERFLACQECAPVSAARLKAIVKAAADEHIALLLLPELHVRPEEIHGLDGTGALLTVAGSFHVGETDVRNRAPVLVDAGHPLWEHDKRGYFRVTRTQVTSAASFEPAPHIAAEVCEGILVGGALTVLDTSLGRLAVVICADALDPNGYVRAVEDARPDMVLVVSMSMETRDFESRAEMWERLGISTLYVNAAPAGKVWGMCWLAVQGSPALPPTRVRWDGQRIEAWRPKEAWKADPSTVAWLHPELGLVVDLSAMVSEGKSASDSAD